MSGGAIAGIVVGCELVAVLVTVPIALFSRHQQRASTIAMTRETAARANQDVELGSSHVSLSFEPRLRGTRYGRKG